MRVFPMVQSKLFVHFLTQPLRGSTLKMFDQDLPPGLGTAREEEESGVLISKLVFISNLAKTSSLGTASTSPEVRRTSANDGKRSLMQRSDAGRLFLYGTCTPPPGRWASAHERRPYFLCVFLIVSLIFMLWFVAFKLCLVVYYVFSCLD